MEPDVMWQLIIALHCEQTARRQCSDNPTTNKARLQGDIAMAPIRVCADGYMDRRLTRCSATKPPDEIWVKGPSRFIMPPCALHLLASSYMDIRAKLA
jgi:hypothetical protein